MAIDTVHMNEPGLDAALAARSATGLRPLRNRRVAVIGDSIASHNSIVGSGNRRTMAYGYLPWAAYLGRQRFSFGADSNYGIPGQTTAEVLPRVRGMLSVDDASLIVIDCLTNDGANGLSVAQSKANYNAIVDQILADGRTVICIAPRPRDKTAPGLTMSAGMVLAHLQRRDFVLGLHNPVRGIYVVDTWEYLADRTSTNMAMIAGVQYDGLHPTQLGAYYDGLAIANLLGMGRAPGLFSFVDKLPQSASDAYDAVNNPTGPLNTNPMMTGGTTNATGYSANVGGAALTATLSKVNSGNAIWQQVVLSGTASSGTTVYPVYQNPVPTSNLAVGDVVEGLCDFEMDAGLTGLSSLGLTITDNTSFARSMCFDTTTEINAKPLPGVAHTGIMRTPRFVLTSTGLRFGIAANAINGAAVAATFRVGAMVLRKIS